MERTPINSSHLSEVGHDPENNTLEVKFRSGRTYQYSGVPRSAYMQILQMPSAGTAFHRIIKIKRFPAREVK